MLAELTLIGYVGSKEFKIAEDGRKYAMIKMATDFFSKKDNKTEEVTMWHTVFINDRYMVERAEMLEKGDLIYTRGSLNYTLHNCNDGTRTITPYQSCDKLRLIKKGKAHLESDQQVLELMKEAEAKRLKEIEDQKKARPLFDAPAQEESYPFEPEVIDDELPF